MLGKETKSTLHIIVLISVFSPILKALVAVIAGAYYEVGISLALFLVFVSLYWFFGIDYFEVHQWFGLASKERDNQASTPKTILHSLVLLTIMGSFLLSAITLATGALFNSALLLAVFIAFSALYWAYGIDFFGMHHLFGKSSN